MADESKPDRNGNTDKGYGYVIPRTGPDAGQKVYATHEASIIGGIKGLINGEAKGHDFTEGGKGVSKAVDDAVASVPGSNDYGG